MKADSEINDIDIDKKRQLHFEDKEELISKISKKNINAIFDFPQFIEYVKNHSKRHAFAKIIQNLMKLKDNLDMMIEGGSDPVEYLLYLYFKEELPIRDISKKMSTIGIDIPKTSMERLLGCTFKWPLRSNHEVTRTTVAKIISSNFLLNNHNPKRSNKIKEKNRRLIYKIIKKQHHFSIEEYENLTTHKERIIYILMAFGLSETGEGCTFLIRNLHERGLSKDSIAAIITGLFLESIGRYEGKIIPKINASSLNQMFFRD